MYNVVHFDLFTIESKREEIFCIIPKVSRMLNGLIAYTEIGCTITRRLLPCVHRQERNFGISLEGKLQLYSLSSKLYIANTANTESPPSFWALPNMAPSRQYINLKRCILRQAFMNKIDQKSV